MTTPQHMTGAELQTLREAIGLSRKLFAPLVCVEPRTIKHWETRKTSCVPSDVVETARMFTNWVIEASESCVRQVRESMQEHGAPREVVLIRYREGSLIVIGLEGMIPEVHGAMITRTALTLMAQKIPVRIVWFDADDYARWLAIERPTHQDTQETRAAWAAQAIDRQAIPHPGDQPPASHTPDH